MPVDLPPNLTLAHPQQNMILKLPEMRHKIQFSGPDNTVWLELDFDAKPPTVNLYGHTPDEAAKVFWNRAALLVELKPLFPDVN